MSGHTPKVTFTLLGKEGEGSGYLIGTSLQVTSSAGLPALIKGDTLVIEVVGTKQKFEAKVELATDTINPVVVITKT